MREILFRGKTKSGDWVYGSLIKAPGYCCILESEENVHPMDYPYLDGDLGVIDGKATPVIPETVGQWTGLVDKNGNKIFEGDVVDTPRWYVDYTGGFGESYGMNAGWYLQRDNYESWMELDCIEDHIILGNIHDNPELLERK